MYKHGLETQETERSSMSHMDDVIDWEMSTFEAMLSAVTIGGGHYENHSKYSKMHWFFPQASYQDNLVYYPLTSKILEN